MQASNMFSTSPIREKKIKKKKDTKKTMSLSPVYKMNEVQNVDAFKNFLLENDSTFSEYINSELLKSTFDTHMMKEGMVTFMA